MLFTCYHLLSEIDGQPSASQLGACSAPPRRHRRINQSTDIMSTCQGQRSQHQLEQLKIHSSRKVTVDTQHMEDHEFRAVKGHCPDDILIFRVVLLIQDHGCRNAVAPRPIYNSPLSIASRRSSCAV